MPRSILQGRYLRISPSTDVSNWWDPGDVDLPVAAAYRAINSVGTPFPGGPANYAESLVNQAAPGVNDLVEGNGAVPWVAGTGWGFVAANAQYFDTGLVPANDQSWSAFVQFANIVSGGTTYLLGAYNGVAATFFALAHNAANNRPYYMNGDLVGVVPDLLSGNQALSGNQGYRDGVADGAAIGVWGGASANAMAIGVRQDGGARFGFISAAIAAVAVYNGSVAAVQAQAAAISTAMAAL